MLALGVGLGLGIVLSGGAQDPTANDAQRADPAPLQFEEYGAGCASCDARHQRLKRKAEERAAEESAQEERVQKERVTEREAAD